MRAVKSILSFFPFSEYFQFPFLTPDSYTNLLLQTETFSSTATVLKGQGTDSLIKSFTYYISNSCLQRKVYLEIQQCYPAQPIVYCVNVNKERHRSKFVSSLDTAV